MNISPSTVISLIAGMVLLVISSFIFTTTIEDIGKRGKFSHTFTGAVISPLFTSLPELAVIIVSLLIIGKVSGTEIAAGTIIGEPFMVSAIGIPVMTIVLIIAARKGKSDEMHAIMPKTIFVLGLIFPLMVIPAIFHYWQAKALTIITLIVIYGLFIYYYKNTSLFSEEGEESVIINRQVLVVLIVVATAALLYGSFLIVNSINNFGYQTGVNREVMALLIIPVGTIIPETLNSVIWASRGKTNLAIGALIGEEVMFATIYPAIGIGASLWIITGAGYIAIALVSSFSIFMGLFTYMFKRFTVAYLFWFLALVIFAILLFVPIYW